jgi:predicted kinase
LSGDAFDYDAMLAQARAMRPKLIGFCGRAGAGKSFAADHLARNYGYSRVRFAGPLKSMMRALGLSEDEVDGQLKETPCALLGGRTPRHAMQTLGTEWARDLIDPDLWVRAWEHAAARYLDQGLPVVVDDVRFANEAASIWRRGGVLIRVDRASVEASTAAHESERQGFAYDSRLTNPGDPDIFRALLGGLIENTATS